MIKWIRKLIGRSPLLIEADDKLRDMNNRADALEATIDGESKWFLRIHSGKKELPREFECQEVKKSEG